MGKDSFLCFLLVAVCLNFAAKSFWVWVLVVLVHEFGMCSSARKKILDENV